MQPLVQAVPDRARQPGNFSVTGHAETNVLTTDKHGWTRIGNMPRETRSIATGTVALPVFDLRESVFICGFTSVISRCRIFAA
jgi:hypothetical protein